MSLSRSYKGTAIREDSAGIYFMNSGTLYSGNKSYSPIYFDYSKGDTFMNTDTGIVYTCTQNVRSPEYGKGKTYTKSWKYTRTEVIYSPSYAPASMSLTRKGTTLTAKWSNPTQATSSKSNSRASALDYVLKYYQPGLTPSTQRSSGVAEATDKTKTFTIYLSDYYPTANRPKVKSFEFGARYRNIKGNMNTYSHAYVYVKPPNKPTATAITQNANTGVCSSTVTYKAASDEEHFRYLAYKKIVTKYNKATSKTETIIEEQKWTQVSATSVTITYDITDRASLQPGEYYTIKFISIAQGIGGDSEEATTTYTCGIPRGRSVSINNESGLSRSSQRIIVNITSDTSAPVPTSYRLQALRSSTYENATDIPGDAEWENVGQPDNGGCSALSVAAGDVLPDAGTHTWLRVKAWCSVEGIFYSYSNYKRLTKIEQELPPTPSAGDDTIVIASCVDGGDGTSAKLSLVWDNSGTDDSNWTEVSWSERPNAWRSTDQPSTFAFADQSWNEGQKTHNHTLYRKSAHVYVTLEPNIEYHIKARRVMRPEEGDDTYGPYSAEVRFTATGVAEEETPSMLTLVGPSMSLRGDALTLTWAYDVPATQTHWQLRRVRSTNPAATDPIISSGSDTRTYLKQPFYTNANRTSSILYSKSDKLGKFYVIGEAGGKEIQSNVIDVQFVDKPTFEIACASPIVTQPATATLFSDSPQCDASIALRPVSATVSLPSGNVTQDGWLWSNTIRPSWTLTSSYASSTEVANARNAMTNKQSAYDAITSQYEQAATEYQEAQAEAERLDMAITEDTQLVADLTVKRNTYMSMLDNMDEDDERYELVSAELQSATDALDETGDRIDVEQVALNAAMQTLQSAAQQMASLAPTVEQRRAELDTAADNYAKKAADAVRPASPGTVTHKATVSLPKDLPLANLGTYEFVAYAIRDGIKSEVSTARFEVSWARRAQEPSIEIGVIAVDETDSDGVLVQGARIELPAPIGAAQTDTYDLYRVTPDGAELAMGNVPFGSTILDKYAAFGHRQYDVVTRTDDGDVDWNSFSYDLAAGDVSMDSFVRIDWNGGYLVLDRGAQQSESFEKDFETRKHLDGSIAGHWRRGTGRTMSIAAQLVRGRETVQEESLRNLARHEGPCLVRTSDGIRIEGSVNVDSISYSPTSARVDVALSVTETSESGTYVPEIEV